jgi:AAA domain/Primase C terminal 1 (PriCT-1)
VPETLNHKYVPARAVTLAIYEPSHRVLLDDLFNFLPPLPDRPAPGTPYQLPEVLTAGMRHDHLWRLARSSKARRMSPEAVRAALEIENQIRCQPPHDAHELDRIVRQAFEQPDRALLPAGPPERTDEEAERAGLLSAGAERLSPAAEAHEERARDERGPRRDRDLPVEALPLISVDELIDYPTPAGRFLVDRLLFDGGVSVTAGKPKAGKSTLMRTLGVAVARGTPWLGRDVRQGPVVYISFEEKRGEVALLFDKLAARGLPIKTYVGKSVVNAVKAIRLAIERLPEPPVLVIIDTLQKLIRVKDLNDYAPVLEALDPILNIAREIGAHICLVHHTVKGERGDPIEEVLGSTAIAGFADTVLVLKRDSHRRRTLWADGRPGVELDEIVVMMDPATQEVSSAGSRQDVEAGDMDRRVLAYLEAQKGPASTELCKKEIEGRAEAIVAALQRLWDRGLITRTGGGKRGDPYLHSVSIPESPCIRVDTGTETGPVQLPLRNQPLSDANSVPESFRSEGGSGTESAGPEDSESRRRRAAPEHRFAVARELVMVVRQGGQMTRDQALAWLRGRIPQRPGHPKDAESLLDGLCLSQLEVGPDGVLIVRAKEETP